VDYIHKPDLISSKHKSSQTTVNSMSIGQQQVGAIQSALLEQLAQVAPGMTQAPQSFTIGTASTPSTSTNYSVSSAPTADPRSSSHTSVDPRTNGPNGAHNSRFVGPPAPTPPLADKASTDAYVKSFGDSGAGNYHTQVQPPYRGRGDFRGGRGRGRGRWDVRGRFDSTAAPQERNNKSRSQSPPGSRYGAARDEGTLSPSRRDYVKNTLSVETDEFGREIRPDVGDRDIDEPVSTDGNASVTAVEPVKAPISSTIGETSGTAVTALVGMESFNFATFDPTAPTSWEALGNAWQVTNGYVPSQEELMQFVMSAYGQPQQAMQSAGATMDPTSSAGAYEGHNGYNTEKVGWQGPYQGRGRGRGAYRGNDRGRGMGRGNYRNGQDQWGHGGDVYNEPSVAHAPVDEYEVRRS
jgi:protein NRD1